jgi:S1-C subfamily serine protease
MRHASIPRALIALAIGLGGCGEGGQTVEEQGAGSAAREVTRGVAPPRYPSGTTVQALQARLQSLYEERKASVVNVTTRKSAAGLLSIPIPREGTSSGFVYDREGHIVTSYHSVEDAENIAVSFGDGKVHEAQLVGKDPSTDLAVLKVTVEDLPEPLPMGSSKDLRPGQFAVALGNPFGLERTLTFGVVSAVGRFVQSPNGTFLSEAIQTDAPVNPGNSGGPLLDLAGRVIGVNAMIVSLSGGSSGVGFAISADTVKKVAPVLIERGAYPHPWLGFRGVDLNRTWISVLKGSGMDVPVDSGIMVVKADPGGPAAEAGIRGGDRQVRVGVVQFPVGGDIVVGIEDAPVASYKDLVLFLQSRAEIGKEVEVTLYRGGEKITRTVRVGERPAEETRRLGLSGR